jgi:FdhD protein
VNVEILRFETGAPQRWQPDEVPEEAPLEIRVEGEPLAVSMRTPGSDRELAAGWLLSEGIIQKAGDIADIIEAPGTESAVVDVILRDRAGFIAANHKRSSPANSSCGLCSATSISQAIRALPQLGNSAMIAPARIHRLPSSLAEHQPVFQRTGGLHACALFSQDGALLAIREDVGRHNALDKLLGWALFEKVVTNESILMLSGRVSFEMIQKSLAAKIEIVAAIGAPTTLAVKMARASHQTLIGFLKDKSFNCYCGVERIRSNSE